MISYELAKKLNDAGFSQIGVDAMSNELDTFIEPDGKLCRRWNIVFGPAYYIPTLPQLIEACGERFGSLEKEPWNYNTDKPIKGWYCLDKENLNGAQGSNPEEAAAKLWLALNK